MGIILGKHIQQSMSSGSFYIAHLWDKQVMDQSNVKYMIDCEFLFYLDSIHGLQSGALQLLGAWI